MSKAFIDRNQQQNSANDQSATTQKKIDPVAQLKWINSQQVDQGWGIPTQMFAEDEEEEPVQAKGVNINSDARLEKEADVMGEKAAQGKMIDVAGKGSGVQMKEDTEPTTLTEATEEEKVKASDVTITYASGVSSSKVKAYAITVIKEDAAKAGIKSIKITSTYRSPETQMSAMYNNIESKGVEDQKKLYGSKGDKVIDAYEAAKKVKNATSTTIQAAMLAKAKEIDFTSAHSKDNYESYNVIDISFKDFTDKEYKAFRKVLDDDSRISKVLGKEESDPCLHVEISIS